MYMLILVDIIRAAENYNAALNGVVMLAVLLRIFAAKVPILRNPFEGLVRSPFGFS
jgi:hypothetical protein